MSRRAVPLVTDQYYHVFNRGVEKRDIFLNADHYWRFFELIRFYQRDHGKRFSYLTPDQREELIVERRGDLLVEIICYALMPNHFHLLLCQKKDGGITKYLRQISDGYSKYFNNLNQRSGHLFQGNFRSVLVESDEQALQLNRYIHLNGPVAGLAERPEQYFWSSYQEYIDDRSGICSKAVILSQFKSIDLYKKFTVDYIDYARKLAVIKHLLLEEPI